MCGDVAIGPRGHLDAASVAALKDFTDRYCRLLESSSHPAAGLLGLGRDLYNWLDGDSRRLDECSILLCQRRHRALESAQIAKSACELTLLAASVMAAPTRLVAAAVPGRETLRRLVTGAGT